MMLLQLAVKLHKITQWQCDTGVFINYFHWLFFIHFQKVTLNPLSISGKQVRRKIFWQFQGILIPASFNWFQSLDGWFPILRWVCLRFHDTLFYFTNLFLWGLFNMSSLTASRRTAAQSRGFLLTSGCHPRAGLPAWASHRLDDGEASLMRSGAAAAELASVQCRLFTAPQGHSPPPSHRSPVPANPLTQGYVGFPSPRLTPQGCTQQTGDTCLRWHDSIWTRHHAGPFNDHRAGFPLKDLTLV